MIVYNSKNKIYMFVYYKPYTANKAKMELYRDVEELRRSVLKDPKRARSNAAKKYLCVRKSKKASAGVTVSIRREAVDEELRYKGWLVLIGNEVMTAQDALDIYRRKDVVEQSFDRLKNVFDMRRLRVHSDQCARAKLLIGFIAQILTSALHNRMKDTELLKKLTLHKLLRLLARWRLAVVCGTLISGEKTKEQRDIMSKLIPDHV